MIQEKTKENQEMNNFSQRTTNRETTQKTQAISIGFKDKPLNNSKSKIK